MKIGLISPKGSFISNNPNFNSFWESSTITSSYRDYWSGLSSGLLILGALTPPYFEVEIVDENINDVDFLKSYDIIGISLMTQQATRAYEIADIFRKNGVPTILGGIHPTVEPQEAKEHADSIVIGEAEPIWQDLLKDFLNKKLKPFYKSDINYDLKKTPLPRYDLLNFKNYKVIWIQTTRGCPHSCEFCAASNVYGKKYRIKSIEQIIEEIDYVKHLFPNVLIGFAEDNLFVNDEFSFSFLQALAPLKIRWMSQTDISISKNIKLLDLIQKSGCAHLLIGFESLSEKNLQKMDIKGWKLNQFKNYSKSIEIIQSCGIGILGSFIVGLDYDQPSTFQSISDFAINNHLYSIQVTILTPFPGTKLRENLKNQNRILPTSWDNYTGFDVNFIHPTLKKKQIENGVLSVYKDFYNSEVYANNIKYLKEVQKKLIKKRLK